MQPVRIKKRPSLSKITSDKRMSQTMTDAFPRKQPLPKIQHPPPPKLPPIRRQLRNISAKVIEPPPESARKETETTLGESTMMFQSMYGGKEWLKPSDYAKEIEELNLLGEERGVEVKLYDINLSEKMERNLQKFGRMREVTEKWVAVLRKAIGYTTSKKASTDQLGQEIKFWKALSRKFDELEDGWMQDERSTSLLGIMRKFLKTEPKFKPLLEQFLQLKEQVILLTPHVKRLYLQLEQIVSGFVVKFQQCSDIRESIALLKNILIGFEAIGQSNKMLRSRFSVIYDKMNQCMNNKLVATSIYPRQLANISSVKQNYGIIDEALSFYSHFISSLQTSCQTEWELVEKAEHSRSVLVNLLQILGYFQHLYKNREVQQFSKLFGHQLNFDIYDQNNHHEWAVYMEMVEQSMQKHRFQP